MLRLGGRALTRLGSARIPNLIKLRIPSLWSPAVGLREMSFVVERETTQTLG